MAHKPRLTLILCGMALVALTGCSSGNPAEPAPGHVGGTLERRQTPPPPDLSAPVTVRLTVSDGSTLSFDCAGRPGSYETIDGCNVQSGTGRFAAADSTESSSFTFLQASSLQARLRVTFRTDRKPRSLLSEGTLAATITTFNPGTCQVGAIWLSAEFNGSLPHFGQVSGTILGRCQF